MKVWTCIDHPTHYPVGGSSVVVAETEEQARVLLRKALAEESLYGEFTLQLLDTTQEGCVILDNGDY